MDRKLTGALVAAFMLSACGGGGQTEVTEAEEALSNDFQPAAPSPGSAGPVPDGGNLNAPMSSETNSQ